MAEIVTNCREGPTLDLINIMSRCLAGPTLDYINRVSSCPKGTTLDHFDGVTKCPAGPTLEHLENNFDDMTRDPFCNISFMNKFQALLVCMNTKHLSF